MKQRKIGIVVGDSKYVVIAGCRHILCVLILCPDGLILGIFLISVWRTLIAIIIIVEQKQFPE